VRHNAQKNEYDTYVKTSHRNICRREPIHNVRVLARLRVSKPLRRGCALTALTSMAVIQSLTQGRDSNRCALRGCSIPCDLW